MRTVAPRRDCLHAPLAKRLRAATRITAPCALVLILAAQVSPSAETLEDGAPIAKGYRIVAPGRTVKNSQLVEFYSYWDSAHYKVRADLSFLDDTASEPISGSYLGDSTVIAGDTTHVWSCYRFTWTLSPSNEREDGAEIPVPVSAVNPATQDSATDEAIRFCLCNDPPHHVGTEVIGDPRRFVVRDGDTLYVLTNGDALDIETTWTFSKRPFYIEADFSAVDRFFDPGNVYYWLADSSNGEIETYSVFYQLNSEAQDAGVYRLPVRIIGLDGGCGRDSVTFLVELDNAGPTGAPVFFAVPDTVAEAELSLTGRAPEDSEDLLIVLNHEMELVWGVFPLGDTLVFEGTLTLQPGTNHLVAYGRDLVGNRSAPSEEFLIELQNVPMFKRCIVACPETLLTDTTQIAVQNGQPIRFYSYWDSRAEYAVYADFSNLDTAEGASQVWATPCENLVVEVGDSLETWYCYAIEHTVSESNELDDDNMIIVPVTAHDPVTGYETTTEALQFCLCNHPPEHLWTEIITDNPDRFVVRDGNTLYLVRWRSTITIHSSWLSPYGALWINADFSNADPYFDLSANQVDKWLIDSLSTDTTRTYGLHYKFSTGEEGLEPYPLPVPIEVRDVGCGTVSTMLLLEMDNEGPVGSPWFEPAPPNQTIAPEIPIAGSAPEGSVELLLVVEHLDADSTTNATLPVDSTLAFSGTAPLLPGPNRLVAYGKDLVGNSSDPSAEYEIHMTTQVVFEIPKPFRPDDTFVFDNPAGWSTLRVEIYNLEGDRIRSWSFEGNPLYHISVPWNGKNRALEYVQQGPYLLRMEATDASGNPEREEVRAFAFKK